MDGHAFYERPASPFGPGNLRLAAGSLAHAGGAGLGDDLGGAHGGTGGRVLLVAVVVLDDLGLGEVGRRRLRELHHEHGAGGEVRRVEQTRPRRRRGGQLLQRLVGKTRRPHHAVDSPRQRHREIARHHVRLREIYEHVDIRRVQRLGQRAEHGEGRLLGMRIDTADDRHVVRGSHRIHHRRAHPPRITRHRNFDHRKPPIHQSDSTRSVNAIVKQQRESEEETGGALTERVPQTVSKARRFRD